MSNDVSPPPPNRPPIKERLKQLTFRASFRGQRVDYGVWLPLSSTAPLSWGLAMSRWRGWLNRHTHRDWIELSVGFAYIAQRAHAGYRQMCPEASEAQLQAWVLGRYQTIAREEFEAQQAITGRLMQQYAPPQVAELTALAARRAPQRGLVILVPHLDNLFLTCVRLAQHLNAVHLVTSAVVEHPQIHAALRRFYREKYAAYEGLMQGGRFMHTSKAAKDFFYHALRQGEAVVILTDAPATAEASGCWMSWFGQRRKVPDGALKMATATGSEMVAVSSVWATANRLAWSVSEMVDPGPSWADDKPTPAALAAYQTLFAFMEDCIRRKPQAWWAAHLMQDYPIAVHQKPMKADDDSSALG
jgi:lauroyl/myristoyl acyltransferase